MDILPVDVLCLIFKHLSFATLVRNMTVNKKWYKTFCSYIDNNMIVLSGNYNQSKFLDKFPAARNINGSIIYKTKNNINKHWLKKENYDLFVMDENIDFVELINNYSEQVSIGVSNKKIVSSYEHITYASVNGIMMYNTGWQYFSYVSKIYIYSTDITDSDLVHFKNIQTIKISYCNNITNNGLKYLEKVSKLNIKSNDNIDESCIEFLPNPSILKILKISNIVSKLNTNSSRLYNNLQELSIFGKNTNYILDYTYKIPEIKIDSEVNLTQKILNNLQNVFRLSLNDTTISKDILKYFSNVNTISFEACDFEDDNDIKYLKNVRKLLLDYSITNFTKVSNLKYLECLYVSSSNEDDKMFNQLSLLKQSYCFKMIIIGTRNINVFTEFRNNMMFNFDVILDTNFGYGHKRILIKK